MKPRQAACPLVAAVLCGCGSAPPEGSLLFGPSGGRSQIFVPGGAGGGAAPGAGGTLIVVPTGGAAGAGGSLLAAGGAGPMGGTSGAGGTPAAGGFGGAQGTGGGLAGTPGAGGTTPGPNGCDYSGTWGSYVVQPVTWPATPLVLFAGEGNLQQWNLVRQRQEGLDVVSETVPCGIFLPDLQSDFFGGYAKFGIRFPDPLFDSGTIPRADFVLHGEVDGSGNYTFATDTFATVIGARLPEPSATAWPAATDLGLVDDDQDGNIGITVIPATGQGYSLPPANLSFETADLIYIACRTVSRLSGSLGTDCNRVQGDVEIVTVGGKPGIDSSVVGCHKTVGAACVDADAAFIDANRPQFTPKTKGTITVVRLPEGATCADVRAQFPLQ